jgi:hypothetical protein
MKFTSTDAWLLHAIHHSNNGKHTSLVNVIAYADHSNHAIITFQEFSNSLPKLIAASLVITDTNGFKTSARFQQWRNKKFKEKKSVSAMKEMIEIEKFLNSEFPTHEDALASMGITAQQFQEAVAKYLER